MTNFHMHAEVKIGHKTGHKTGHSGENWSLLTAHVMLAACEGCSEERRARCAARQQTWAMGTVASGIDDGVALGDVRDQEFHVAGGWHVLGRAVGLAMSAAMSSTSSP